MEEGEGAAAAPLAPFVSLGGLGGLLGGLGDKFVPMPAVKLVHEFSHPCGGSLDASFRAWRTLPVP